MIRLSSKLSKLRKERISKRKEESVVRFLQDDYCLPTVYVSLGTSSSEPPSSSASSSVDWEKENLLITNKELSDELSEQSSELEQVEEKLKKLQIKMYSKHRNDQKKIKRRDQQLKIKEKELKEGKQLLKGLQTNLSNKN